LYSARLDVLRRHQRVRRRRRRPGARGGRPRRLIEHAPAATGAALPSDARRHDRPVPDRSDAGLYPADPASGAS